MYVGSHGAAHVWMSRLSVEQQAADVDRSLEMLRACRMPTDRRIMCYPYRDSNDRLRALLRARGCAVGLTTAFDLASCDGDALSMPRLDTNDLPKVADAALNDWTRRIHS
jgi:hypothetical protein